MAVFSHSRLEELLDRLVGIPQDNTSASEKHEVVDMVRELIKVAETAHEALWNVDLDPEHVVSCHTKDLDKYYLNLHGQVTKAKDALDKLHQVDLD